MDSANLYANVSEKYGFLDSLNSCRVMEHCVIDALSASYINSYPHLVEDEGI